MKTYTNIQDLAFYKNIREISKIKSHELMTLKRGVICDSWNTTDRWIYLWKIPLFIRERTDVDTIVRLLGIPVIKLIRIGKFKKYCIFNIPIKTKERSDILSHKDMADIQKQISRLNHMEEEQLESSF